MTYEFLANSGNSKILTNGQEQLALLEFNEDRTAAYLTVSVPVDGKTINSDEIISSLKNEGILGIDRDIIQLTIKNNQFNSKILIASGILPIKGESAYLLYQFGTEEACLVDEGPAIEIIPGQILTVKVPPKYGIPGTTVTGETIIPQKGNDIEIIPGKNTAISPDGLKVYATNFGNVIWTENKVEIEKVLEIPEDVDKDIDFEGNIVIAGDVQDGFKVKATGNIHVGKNIGKAILETATGDVYGQVLDGSQIKAANIFAKSVKSANLEATKNVLVNEEIINSQVTAQKVILRENKGLISGGKITAHSLIEAKVIGNKDDVPPTLIVDADGKVAGSSSIYPGTKITIGNITIAIKKEVNGVLYHKIEDSVIQSKYEPDRIKEEVELPSQYQIYSGETPPSVIVNANSLSEAREIGAELLNLAPSEVDCQMGIIEENLNEASLSLIRVFQLGIKGPWEEGWRKKIKDEIFRLNVDNIEGIFEFFNTDTGLYLSIFPPKGTGKIVTLQDVLNYIEKKGFLDVNQDLLKKVVEHPSPKPSLVGPRQRVLELDGKVEIEVAPDHSNAVMFVIPPKHGGLPASFEDAMETLREKEVVAGIDERAMAKAIFEQTTKPVLVAEAILPTPGDEAKLEYKFRVDRSRVELVEDEYGRVDFKRLNLVENVRAGQILVVKRPPGKGMPGKLVNGLDLPALSGSDVRMPVGRNTEVSLGGTELISTLNGQVLLAGDKVNVEDTLEIKGDVNLQTGNIYFLGTIIIQGNVEDDFEVEATGDIQIKNSVGKCFLSAGGSIAIGEGVKGKGKARLFAGQHIFAKYIENARIEAKGTVQVTQEIMHSQADAGKSILLEGKQRGSIIGGKVRAGDEIRAREIGAPAGTYTRVEVGGTPKVREQLESLNRLYFKDVNRLETIKKDISILKDKKNQEKEKFPIEKEAKLQKIIREHNKLTVKLHRYTDQKEFLEVRIQEALGGAIYVSHILFQGVSIGIRNANLEIKDNYNSVSLGPKGDEVGIFPYGVVQGGS
ncbi:MAG: FapA family protein [Nitrospirota bacterium]